MRLVSVSHYAHIMLVRVVVDVDVPDDDPRQMGEVSALQRRDGQKGRYVKSLISHSSTEDDSLRFISVDRR